MNEKEKMQQGQLYDANFDPTLLKERQIAKDLCHEFNNLKPSDLEGQRKILQKLLGRMEEDITVIGPFWCDYGYNIEIGKNFFSNHNLVILDAAKVEIGDNVFVGPNCGFYTSGHPILAEERNAGLEYALPIRIGDNVWIGADVHILPGVTIGANAIIGAGSVVNKDVPDNVIAAGNPFKVIREISEEENE